MDDQHRRDHEFHLAHDGRLRVFLKSSTARVRIPVKILDYGVLRDDQATVRAVQRDEADDVASDVPFGTRLLGKNTRYELDKSLLEAATGFELIAGMKDEVLVERGQADMFLLDGLATWPLCSRRKRDVSRLRERDATRFVQQDLRRP